MQWLDHGVDSADASIALVAYVLSAGLVAVSVVGYLVWRRRERRQHPE